VLDIGSIYLCTGSKFGKHNMKSITELWAPVLINDGIFKDDYLVSNMGRVKHKRTFSNGKIKYFLIKVINGKRPIVKITSNGKVYSKSVAKLVLSSFQYREGCECANITYLDGNMKNCRLSNLRYTADKSVYTKIELDKQQKPDKPKQKAKKEIVQPIELKSCMTCAKRPCMTGMSNLSSDFGALGCVDYEPENKVMS